MINNRVNSHPILETIEKQDIPFFWENEKLLGKSGDTIASALVANNIHIFNFHPKTNSPQGIFCANGQCAQCMVLVNGFTSKACMTELKSNMKIEPLVGYPKLTNSKSEPSKIIKKKIEILIIGGGPAGLSVARELSKFNTSILLVDDKQELGGKLTLQTHRFFGSSKNVYAGKRGFEIGKILSSEVSNKENIEIWLNSTCVAVFSDKKIGIIKENKEYAILEPEVVVFATGAREKSLKFSGNSLPGVYGAGAFQTLLNRDLIKPSSKLLIVGGGNVGLIAAYHALQANIEVVGVLEASSNCGGYKVHLDKIKRLGVKILTSHTITQAIGDERVEKVIISKLDKEFNLIENTSQEVECDTVLLAVGLSPVDEFLKKAKEYEMNVFSAGDCSEIAEASAAIFSGKIIANKILQKLGIINNSNITDLEYEFEILKSKPGNLSEEKLPLLKKNVYPIFHCVQEIPCDPCSNVCPYNLIKIDEKDIRKTPYLENIDLCIGCGKCLINCSGLAISIVDYRKDNDFVEVSIPLEFTNDQIGDDELMLVDILGNDLGLFKPRKIIEGKNNNKTKIIRFIVPPDIAEKVIGFRLPMLNYDNFLNINEKQSYKKNQSIICRCEQVSEEDIRKLIKSGITDLNQIKAITRAGMGACQAKTCETLILQMLKEESISQEKITEFTKRPFFVDIPMKMFVDDEE